jgi:hypothetical protein
MMYALILIGVGLIIVNYKAVMKEKSSFNSILEDKSRNIDDVDIRIGELRREFSETILELQKEIVKLKSLISNNKIEEGKQDLEVEELEEEVVQVATGNTSDNNSIRIYEIEELLKSGTPLEEICEKFNIGKGEVLLIQQLYLK